MKKAETIYIIFGHEGEYDDYREWPIIAYRDEKKASSHMAILLKGGLSEREIRIYDPVKKRHAEGYFLEELELVSDLPEMPEVLGFRMINSIESINDIQELARSGFEDWGRFGGVRVSQKDDLLLFNYTHEANGRWNYFEGVSRGLIINGRTGEVVARPFDKFFNWMEDGRKSDAEIEAISEKVDGSLGVLYRHFGEYKIATRGSFDGEQATWATEFLKRNYNLENLPERLTLIFEIVYPGNRIVVNYRGEEFLSLLAARDRFTGSYESDESVSRIADTYGFKSPRRYVFKSVEDLLSKLPTLVNEEGYVVSFADGQRFKFKGEEYLRLHKLIASLSFKNAVNAVRSGIVDEVMENVPNEFLHEFRGQVAQVEQTVLSVKQRVIDAMSEYMGTADRKAFAQWVLSKHQGLAPYLFAKLDGKDIFPLICDREFK